MSTYRKSPQSVMVFAVVATTMLANGCATQGIPLAKKSSSQKNSQPQANFSVARAHEHEGNLVPALEMYESLYETNHDDAQVCHRLGVVKLRMGAVDEGVTYLMEANSLEPNNGQILSDLGYAYIMHGDFESAEDYLREALNRNPDDLRSVNNLAMAVGYQGRMDECFSLYRNAVGQAEAHANVGYIYSQRGETEQAIRHYSKALDLDPNLRSAGEALVQIVDIETQVAEAKTELGDDRIQLTKGVLK